MNRSAPGERVNLPNFGSGLEGQTSDSPSDIAGEKDVGDKRRGDGRKSGNESSAIGTLR